MPITHTYHCSVCGQEYPDGNNMCHPDAAVDSIRHTKPHPLNKTRNLWFPPLEDLLLAHLHPAMVEQVMASVWEVAKGAYDAGYEDLKKTRHDIANALMPILMDDIKDPMLSREEILQCAKRAASVLEKL